MKKSLKVIASAAIAMSAFASVAMADAAPTTSTTATATAAAKTSADFKDLANVDAALKAKIDAMLAAGVFEGVSNDTFGIDQNMTRAQAAKVLTLIYNIKVDTTVKTSSFTDVKADDAANGWAIPYIEAAKKAGLIDGVTDTTFAPGDNVTLGQFAKLLVTGLGKKVDVTGTPWYADAVKQAVALNLLPASTDGSKLATRADLVGGAYAGQQANMPAQVSVASVKATGVQTVTVNFDRDVDTSKATLALTKGTLAVKTTAKFSDDKKSATLTLTDTKLSAGDYTVTLGGLDASAIKTATGTFTAQDEQVAKIEFTNANDTIAQSQYAAINIKATNQYGENASFSAGNYTFQIGNTYVINPKLTQNSDGTLTLTVDTKTNATQLPTNIAIVPVTIWSNDTHVSASKNFTVGTAPFITKMELGGVTYSNAGNSITKTGETATFAIKAYDQYGATLGFNAIQSILNTTATDLATNSLVQVIFSPYEQNLQYHVQDFDNNNTPEVRVSLANNVEKSGDYTAQVYMQGASATAKISVSSNAVANKIQVGDVSGVVASGDTDVYVPVTAYDAQGNQLSASDLTSAYNLGRIHVNVSGATVKDVAGNDITSNPTILSSGDHIGYIRLGNITAPTKGVVTVTAYIATANANSSSTKSFTVNNVRTPDHLKVTTEPASKLVPGATTSFTVQTIDQYGANLDNAYVTDANGNIVTSNNNALDQSGVAGNVYYYVNFAPVANANVSIYKDGDANKTALTGNYTNANPAVSVGNNTYATQTGGVGKFDATIDIAAATNASGSTGFTATLYKQVVGQATPVQMSQVTRSLNIAQTTDSLTYSLNSVATLWNAYDSGLVTDATYGSGTLTAVTQKDPTASKFARQVTVSATDAAGNKVALTNNIVAITSSNTNVAQVGLTSGKAYVIGNKAGTASLAVSYTTNDGQIKTVNTNVTVKGDALAVDHIIAGNTGLQKVNSGTNAWDTMDIQVYDNYGVEYEKQDALHYNYLFGVVWSVTNVNGSASVDQYGNITGTSGTTFNLIATSASGKTVVTPVYIN